MVGENIAESPDRRVGRPGRLQESFPLVLSVVLALSAHIIELFHALSCSTSAT